MWPQEECALLIDWMADLSLLRRDNERRHLSQERVEL